MPSPIVITARHFAKRAPSFLYSTSRSRNPSRPCVRFSFGALGSATAPVSTLMPGMMPLFSSSLGKGVPSFAFCLIVSSYRITPLMKSAAPGVVKSMSR